MLLPNGGSTTASKVALNQFISEVDYEVEAEFILARTLRNRSHIQLQTQVVDCSLQRCAPTTN